MCSPHPMTTCPGMCPPHQSTIMKIHPQLYYRPVWWRKVLNWESLSPHMCRLVLKWPKHPTQVSLPENRRSPPAEWGVLRVGRLPWNTFHRDPNMNAKVGETKLESRERVGPRAGRQGWVNPEKQRRSFWWLYSWRCLLRWSWSLPRMTGTSCGNCTLLPQTSGRIADCTLLLSSYTVQWKDELWPPNPGCVFEVGESRPNISLYFPSWPGTFSVE